MKHIGWGGSKKNRRSATIHGRTGPHEAQEWRLLIGCWSAATYGRTGPHEELARQASHKGMIRLVRDVAAVQKDPHAAGELLPQTPPPLPGAPGQLGVAQQREGEEVVDLSDPVRKVALPEVIPARPG